MSAPGDIYKGQRVRVTAPIARHQHMRGCVGRVTEKGKGGTYQVSFMGGKGFFHVSELEPAQRES